MLNKKGGEKMENKIYLILKIIVIVFVGAIFIYRLMRAIERGDIGSLIWMGLSLLM